MASMETKKILATASSQDITKRCQQAIENANIKDIKLRGVNKLAKNDIRLQCESEEKAKQLQAIDWNSAFKGLKVRKATYGLVIHGVQREDINLLEPNTTAELLQQENTNINITKVTPLRRKPKTEAKHHSIIVFTEDSAAVDRCIREGFYINYRRYQPERYTPHLQVMQCFKCGEYGHRVV